MDFGEIVPIAQQVAGEVPTELLYLAGAAAGLWALKAVLEFLLKAGYIPHGKKNGNGSGLKPEELKSLFEMPHRLESVSGRLHECQAQIRTLVQWHAPGPDGIQEWRNPGGRATLKAIERNTEHMAKSIESLAADIHTALRELSQR